MGLLLLLLRPAVGLLDIAPGITVFPVGFDSYTRIRGQWIEGSNLLRVGIPTRTGPWSVALRGPAWPCVAAAAAWARARRRRGVRVRVPHNETRKCRPD